MQLLHFILAVLDVTVSEDNVSINRELLEADENGYAPKHNEFRAPSCYDVIAEERLTVRYSKPHYILYNVSSETGHTHPR